MAIKRLAAAPGLPTTFPFSLAGGTDGICFISGMPSVDASGAFAAGTFVEETERAWRNVVAIAGAAGYSVEEILYVQCVLADIENYSELNDWWRRQFPDVSTAPARFTFQAGALPFGAKIELQAVAGH
jgi:2-iminobutanoate/2-iminopropanoate deaminase